MCQSPIKYEFEVQKQRTETKQYVTCYSGKKKSRGVKLDSEEVIIPKWILGGTDQFRIALIFTKNKKVFNSFTVSLKELEKGPKTFNGRNGAILDITDFETYERRCLVDYILDGW